MFTFCDLGIADSSCRSSKFRTGSFCALRTVVLLVLISNALPCRMTQGQTTENFESFQHSPWKLAESSAASTRLSWTNEVHPAAGRRGSAAIQMGFSTEDSGQATAVLPVAPAFAIAELQYTLWCYSPTASTRVELSVVLPRTRLPGETTPLRLLIAGPSLPPAESWQQLAIGGDSPDVVELIERRVWQLREQLGSRAAIDISQAYVDQMRLVIAAPEGSHRVWIDDLRIDGQVDVGPSVFAAENAAGSSPNFPVQQTANLQQEQGAAQVEECPYRQNASVLEYRGRPIALRCIEYNGESLRFLRETGFNCIELAAPATPEFLQQVTEQGLWAICPPPAQIGLYQLPRNYDCVVAWKMGPRLTHRDLAFVRQSLREIRQGDYWSQRPVILDVASHWTTYGRLGTILGLDGIEIGSSQRLHQMSHWVEQRRQIAGNPPTLVSVPTDLPAATLKQVAAVTGRLPPTPLSVEQVQYSVYEALSGGARGIRFRSAARLDAADPGSRLKALTLRWINRELEVVHPWMAGGAVTRREEIKADGNGSDWLDLTEINTSQARLMLIQRSTGNEQWYCGDADLVRPTYNDTRALTSDQAYWLGPESAETRSQDALHGGLDIDLRDCGICAAFVITQSPQVIRQLRQGYSRMPELSAPAYRIELSRNWLAILQLLDQQNAALGGTSVAIRGQLDQADTYLRQATLAGGQSVSTDRSLLLANQQLAYARREMVLGARRGFTNSLASPLTNHCTLISDHYRLTSQAAELRWTPNALAGGDFEDLAHMQRHGWENQRLDSSQYQTQVELAPAAAVSGKMGLRMQVVPQSAGRPGVLESTPLWISTPAMPVKAGQMVRLHGWVRIGNALQGSPRGLCISDNISGSALAETFLTTNGQWQEFTLYRMIPADAELEFKIELCGYGTADIDELTLQTAELPPLSRSASIPSN